MTTQKLEYDSTLGGPIKLPGHVPTFRYAASAMREMRQLLSAINNPTSTKLVFQTLPKHMRRRAMSHHPKRLPRKYRAAHRAQMAKAGKPQQSKRPSRKYRRRPGNLLREYIRRQRRHVWLETHIWHARRFHMIERWGYRLPYASCDKTYRACYRASAEHCLLQDISYYACVQLEGSLEQLRAGFARLSSAECGLSITAKTYSSGRREGSIELFRDGEYPAGALGSVSFIWRPLEGASEEAGVQRTLWLWVHPSAYQTILQELIKVFQLVSLKTIKVRLKEEESDIEETTTSDERITTAKTVRVKAQRRLQFMTRTFAYERNRRYQNAETKVQLSELKDKMNRFRLTGPLAQTVLSHALKTTTAANSNPDAAGNWFYTRLAADKVFQNSHLTQANYWQECSALSSPAELLSNMIIGLNVVDPRVNRPEKRTKAMPPSKHAIPADFLLDTPSNLAQTAIWQSSLRESISQQMLSTHAYCELRAKHAVVPGAACKFEEALQPIPLLLIQRPGSQQPQNKRLGYGCGWDVIAPAGYGMPLWLALVMWGARPGGLREFETISRELGTEQHLPDTVAGLQLAGERHAELRAKYFRQPPNKRCNYHKFAIASPFRAPFAQLVRDWLPTEGCVAETQGFHVLRSRSLLQQLNACLNLKRVNTFPKQISPNCLIQLQLRMKSRGNLEDFALICLPTRADFKRNLKQIKRENHDPVYTEPLLPDLAEKERKLLRLQHKKQLKRLRGRRVREKRKLQESSTKRVHIRAAGTAELVTAQWKRMCALWLPEDYSTLFSIRKQCTREVFGYMTTASFSYTEATVCAVGYVTVEGLKQLLSSCQQMRMKQPMCLVRSPKSRHYRFASFKLNLQVC